MVVRRAAILALTILILAAAVAEARKWTTRDGKFSVEAELLDIVDGHAVLQKTDGKTVKVPIEKLSLADNLYIKEAQGALQKDPPAQPPVEPSSSNPSSDSAARPESADVKAPPATWKERPLTQANRSEWQVGADPSGEKLEIPADSTLSIRLRQTYSSKVLYPSAHVPYVAVVNESDKVYESYNLNTGKKLGQIREKLGSAQHLALSPDGKLLASVSLEQHSKVLLWSFVTGKEARALPLSKPYASIRAVKFAGPDRVLVSNSSERKIIVWNVHTGHVTAEIDYPSPPDEKEMAVSPGGSYVAVSSHNRPIEIFDTRNGELAGELDTNTDYRQTTGMAFSPDGSEFAAAFQKGTNHALACWSMETGKQLAEHTLKKVPYASGNGETLVWFADNSAWLVNGKAVVDRKIGGPVWTDEDGGRETARRYIDAERMLEVGGGRESQALSIVRIPKDRIAAGSQVVAGGGVAVDAELPKLTVVSGTAATIRPARGAWKYTPAAAPLPKAYDPAKPLHLGNWARIPAVVKFSRPDVARVVIGAKDQDLRDRQKNNDPSFSTPNHYQVFDLQTQKSLHTFLPTFATQLEDVSPDGRYGAFLLEKTKDRLDVYDLEGNRHVVGFRPYGVLGDTDFRKRIKWVGCGNGIVLTLNDEERCVAWQLPDAKPLYEIAGVNAASFDAARTTLAVAVRGNVFLIDAATGATLGALDGAGQANLTLARGFSFSADGLRLACACLQDRGCDLVTWELAKGTVAHEMRFPFHALHVTWMGSNYVLLHNTALRASMVSGQADISRYHQASLIDLEKGMVAWTYQHHIMGGVESAPGDLHWHAAPPEYGQPGRLIALSLPDPAARAALEKITGVKPLVGPGSKLAVEVDVVGTFPASADDKESRAVQLKKQVTEHLAAALEKEQITVESSAPAKLRVSLQEKSTTHAIELRGRYSFERGPILQLSKTTVVITAEIITENGQRVWEDLHIVGDDELGTIDLRTRPAGVTPEVFLRSHQWNAASKWVRAMPLPLPLHSASAFQGAGETLIRVDGLRNIRLPDLPAEGKEKGDKRT